MPGSSWYLNLKDAGFTQTTCNKSPFSIFGSVGCSAKAQWARSFGSIPSPYTTIESWYGLEAGAGACDAEAGACDAEASACDAEAEEELAVA